MKTFTFDEAFTASVNYFSGDELAAKVFLDKYALKNQDGQLLEDTPEMMHWRLANEFGRIEEAKFEAPLSPRQIFEYLQGFKYIVPQGSPMFGIGNNFQTISLSNCFVVEPPLDSYGGILRCDEHLVQIAKRRGGDGTDLSNLRPAGAKTRNAAKSSTGLVGFSERFSNSIREVGQHGRRGALMLNVSIHHPDSIIIPEASDPVWEKPVQILIKGNPDKGERDIETLSCFYNPNQLDFASMKLDRTKVTGANVSIRLTDEFLKAVEQGKDYEQRFPVDSSAPQYSKMVNARNAWKKIIHMAWQSAEPGLLFWDRITKYNAVDCYAKDGFATVSTNPCSEIPLCAYDSCRLLLVNLYSFVDKPFTRLASFNWKKFDEVTRVALRLMDDLIDLELEKIDAIINKICDDPEPKEIKRTELELWRNIKLKCELGRRTGLGVTGLADMLAALGLAYSSKKALEFVGSVFREFKHSAFDASCDIAKEIGPFPIWDWEKEKDSEFLLQIKKENPILYTKISKYGRRNIGLLTLAPAGSVSILTQTASGGEPVFAPFFVRRKKINPNDKHVQVDFVDGSGDSWQHYKVYHPPLKAWMAATGKTNIEDSPYHAQYAADIDWKFRVLLQAAIQEHLDHAISSTVNLPNSATEDDVALIYNTAWKAGCKGITVYRDGCRSGVLVNNETKETKLLKTTPPKRPKELKAEIFATSYKKDKLYVAVGFLGDEPYEVFTGSNAKQDFKTAKGLIRKNSRGRYVFVTEDGEEYLLTNGHNDENADALTRMISCALRHGSDIEFVVHQLEKTEGDLFAFAKVVARVLKKYIPDGTKISGDNCPSCGNQLVRENGCSSCKNCGWSKC